MRKATIKLEDITLYDLLTVDTHGERISIEDEAENSSYDLIPGRSTFFSPDGLYADVEEKSIVLLRDNRRQLMDLDYLLKTWDRSQESCVILIEGFAGCGKSTLVQYILLNQLKTFKYNYSFFNYDLEAQNDIITHDDKGEVIKRSSIYEAIKKSFFEQFIKTIKINKNVFNDFSYLLKLCREYQQFDKLYFDYYITDTFEEISLLIEESVEKNEKLITKNLWKQTSQISSSTCVLALDYLFRLAMYKNRMLDKLYVCYDNLDAIEDADDLKNFDDDLVRFSWFIDYFIILAQRKQFFLKQSNPHFVILATYRKITAVMANISDKAYREVMVDKYAGPNCGESVYHIDATSIYSYGKIVAKRKQYFSNYFKIAPNISKEAKKELLKELSSWNKLNQTLAIMHNRYSCLWNKNYRTCSQIANELYKKSTYQFYQYVDHIEASTMNDGYCTSEDIEGNNILCSYYGGSAILLSSICKVFHSHHIWDRFLFLVPLNTDGPSYKKVSFSRMILTYIYNCPEPVTFEDLFNTFCKNGLFPYTKLCKILANMLARNTDGVWRRPIYYYSNEYMLPTKTEDIEKVFLKECRQLTDGTAASHNYEFILCDSGRSYVERLMQEFEFFSNRLSNKNKPLYLYTEIAEIEAVVNSVYLSVLRCCENMGEFRKKYIEATGITAEKYLSLPIHPTTNITHSSQLHTERIIFSHIAYLNNVRLYYLNEAVMPTFPERKKYNKTFVSFIEKYLNLYYTHIKPVSEKRTFIAEQLIEIVKKINKAIEQEKDEPNILFQSISLNNRT